MPPVPASPAAIRAQYERWPYPRVPLLASLPSTHPFELHAAWLWDRCGSGPAPARPRVWIAGCGTMQPYVFGIANPKAEITATDLSQRSLDLARTRCRLRRMAHVGFAWADLDDPATWPEGEFDLIECYGVLMNLPDPARTLRQLASRLTPRGVLRLMVYPWFSRARICQIQRLARLLGLHAGDASHPRRLRTTMRSLPRRHPLRHAFTTYADARNDAGLVDGFLHAGDRGFTGWQLGAMVRAAGLRPAFWFHRPWARPEIMGERLGLPGRGHDFVMAYLDLWQELRANFVVCLRRDDAPAAGPVGIGPHPMFGPDHGGLRHRLRLLRLQWLGGSLPARTQEDPVRITSSAAQRLLRADLARLSPGERARLEQAGLVLGAGPSAAAPAADPPFPREAELLAPRLELGRRAPNPFYSHLFAAFRLARDFPELGLPDLETQCARWGPWADPLEESIRFGLTPYGTLQRFRNSVLEHLAQSPGECAADLAAVRLRDDAAALAAARGFLARHGAHAVATDAELRELWLLVFSHTDLFLALD